MCVTGCSDICLTDQTDPRADTSKVFQIQLSTISNYNLLGTWNVQRLFNDCFDEQLLFRVCIYVIKTPYLITLVVFFFQ